MRGYYILDEAGNPVPEPNLRKWGQWFENTANRIVRQDTVGSCLISTVFLGIDHNFTGRGPPILWETQVFVGDAAVDEEMYRHTSRAAALNRHAECLARYRGMVRDADTLINTTLKLNND